MKLIIVTGGDEAYAPFVADLAQSLLRLKPVANFTMGCLDYGLSPQTRDAMSKTFERIVAPEWPFRPNAQFEMQIQARAFATRPFLPEYFPGFDAYAWIDADSFVQDVRAVALLAAASAGGLAGVVPTVDRSYRHQKQTVQWVFERYRMAFGTETATRLMQAPYIASGVVAGSAASPLWKMWQHRLQAALDRWDGPRLCDQAILNHVVYLEGLTHHKLPSACNWISHLAPPVVDIKRGALVEPAYPFEPLYIVANSFNDKHAARRLVLRGGGSVACPFTFAGVRNAILAERAKAQ